MAGGCERSNGQCCTGSDHPLDGNPSSQVVTIDAGKQFYDSTRNLDSYETSVSNTRKMLISHLSNHPPVTLEFNELSFSIGEAPPRTSAGFGPYASKPMKSILKGASGIFKPGELTAIMGPSGAGKSTLMNILAGHQTQNVQGSIRVNGKRRDLSTFRKMSCYVMQDDVLNAHLTVYESMSYAAQLKLPRKTPISQRELVIGEILDIIGLGECKYVISSAISGGQRKRLAIAQELINSPSILFLDEPTSGLDSASCVVVVALLKALAQGGRTIIATIHQPSSRIFAQFDALYLLAGGECLYQGPTSSVLSFVASQGLQCPPYHSPAEFVIAIASGDYGNQWISIITKASSLSADSNSSGLASSEGTQDGSITPPPGKNKNTPFGTDSSSDLHCGEEGHLTLTLIHSDCEADENCGDFKSMHRYHQDSRMDLFTNQFFTLLSRSFLCASRDMMLTHLRFTCTVAIALLVGAVYHDVGSDASKVFHNAGNLFFGLLFMVFLSMLSTLLTFPLERGVVIREHLNCWYSLKAYFLARTCADLPFQIFFPLLYVSITYHMTDQPREAFRFGIVAGIHIGISLVGQSIGLLIGAACDVGNAVFVGPISTIPILLLGGFFVSIHAVPGYLRWLSWLSYVKYSFQSTLTAVYGFHRDTLKCTEAYCHFKHPEKFLEQIDAADIDVSHQAMCLLVVLVTVRILAYYALRFKIMVEKR